MIPHLASSIVTLNYHRRFVMFAFNNRVNPRIKLFVGNGAGGNDSVKSVKILHENEATTKTVKGFQQFIGLVKEYINCFHNSILSR